MSTKQLRLLLALGALAAGELLTYPAHAALGGSPDSVTADSSALRGQMASTAMVAYDVHEIDSGELAVREYVTRSGQVFAVTWRGPTMPDLQQLLGTYFPRFQSAAAAAHAGNPGIHRELVVSQADLVIVSTGRMRDFQGLAYLPGLVPAGVSVDQLQ